MREQRRGGLAIDGHQRREHPRFSSLWFALRATRTPFGAIFLVAEDFVRLRAARRTTRVIASAFSTTRSLHARDVSRTFAGHTLISPSRISSGHTGRPSATLSSSARRSLPRSGSFAISSSVSHAACSDSSSGSVFGFVSSRGVAAKIAERNDVLFDNFEMAAALGDYLAEACSRQ